jgi:biopolymer transport protein ExbB
MVWRTTNTQSSTRRLRGWLLLSMLATALVCTNRALSYQDDNAVSGETTTQEAEAGPVAGQLSDTDDAADENLSVKSGEGINILSLLVEGSWFMIPIVFMSLITVTFVVERFLGLRQTRVFPEELKTEVGNLADRFFDEQQNLTEQERPEAALKFIQGVNSAGTSLPSVASNVLKVMCESVGRPLGEVEHAVVESSEREAEKLYTNVRWLTLSAAVAPLMGLLGTVWGMIRAFHDTTQLLPGQNKADYLAGGIYAALVTTLGGLMVAIPAAIFAHYFETRIQKMFYQIDEFLAELTPATRDLVKPDGSPRVRTLKRSARNSAPQPPLVAADQQSAAETTEGVSSEADS